MSYKFDKADVYLKENRFLELTAEVFKIAFDIPKEKFKEVKMHQINSGYYSCSSCLNDDDLIYHISDDIVLTIEHYRDVAFHKSTECTRYSLYVCSDNFEEGYTKYKWYLISYIESDNGGKGVSYINVSDLKIQFSQNNDYIECIWEQDSGQDSGHSENQSSEFNYPFTKDMYFNYSIMNNNLSSVTFEVLNSLLEIKIPDGFIGNFYDY